jgi:hypothetical protein
MPLAAILLKIAAFQHLRVSMARLNRRIVAARIDRGRSRCPSIGKWSSYPRFMGLFATAKKARPRLLATDSSEF